MTISYTALLGLAQPVTGTETGQWGTVVNDEITALLEDAVANAASISVTAGNVTLSTTNGSSNQARMSTLIITGTPGTTRNVVAPSQAKIYVVINQSDGAVVIKGAATSGVTIGAGQTAQVAWNGSDFVEIGNYVHGNFVVNGNLSVNGDSTLGNAGADTTTINGQVIAANSNISKTTTLSASAPALAWIKGATYTDTGTAGGTTQALAPFTVFSTPTLSTSNIVTYTDAATVYIAGAPAAAGSATITNPYSLYVAAGNAYFGASVSATTLDLTNLEVTNIKAKDGTASMTLADTTGIITLSATAGTANGVAYLNGSRALATGSALTFDGTKLGVASGNIDVVSASFVGSPLIAARFNASNLRMGIGIGNSNGFPFLGVNVNNAANDNGTFDINGYANRIRLDNGVFQVQTSSVSGTAGNAITWTTPMTLDASGRLLVKATSNTGANTKLAVGSGLTSGNAVAYISTENVDINGVEISNWTGSATTNRVSIGFDNSGWGSFRIGMPGGVNAFQIYDTLVGAERARITSTGGFETRPAANGHAVFNEDGVDADFRVESDADTHCLFVDASANNVGIGTNAPNNKLTVQADASTSSSFADNGVGQLIIRGNTDSTKRLALGIDTTNNIGVIQAQQYGTGVYDLTIQPSGGNVGIGTNSPFTALSFPIGTNKYVGQTAPTAHLAGNAGSMGFGISDGGGQTGVFVHNTHDGTFSSQDIRFLTAKGGISSATERARITSGGVFLVNTTSQLSSGSYGVHEIRGDAGSGGQSALVVYNTNASDASPAINAIKHSSTTTSSQRFIQFYANAGSQAMGGIVGNGAENVQFATISDVREKTNIQPVGGSLEKIVALKPVSFDWIKSGEHVKAGFVAQDVEQVFPEFVVENMANDGEEARKGLTGGMTGGIIAHLVAAIKEQQAMINELKAEVAALKGA